MKRLLIDAGNTNVKLALVDGDNWLDQRILFNARPFDFDFNSDVQQILVSNVAGADIGRKIIDACARYRAIPQFIQSQPSQCGVRNGYTEPSRLGCDRWAALIAARHRFGGACLVVNSGTATTIDALSADGEFIGGLILPGVALMQRSLVSAAADLQEVKGSYRAFPLNTGDALFSGAIQASCGAVQRQYAQLKEEGAPVFICGGAAPLLSQYLDLPLQMIDNLVIEGLLLIARDMR